MMVCLSHKGTLDLIDSICVDHDSIVTTWRDSLADAFLPQCHTVSEHILLCIGMHMYAGTELCCMHTCSILSIKHAGCATHHCSYSR